MKHIKSLHAILMVFLAYSCGGIGESGHESSNTPSITTPKKEEKVIQLVKDYIQANQSQIEFKNYDFLLEYHNKLRPCPEKPYKIKVYDKDEITAETSIYFNQVHEYLNPDPKLGELDTYGISFKIEGSSMQVESQNAYASFTKWSNGKPGERESLGSEFVSFDPGKVPDFRSKYGNEKQIKEVDQFFSNEMEAKQAANKSKCF